jgi:hypothetical protein
METLQRVKTHNPNEELGVKLRDIVCEDCQRSLPSNACTGYGDKCPLDMMSRIAAKRGG